MAGYKTESMDSAKSARCDRGLASINDMVCKELKLAFY